MEKCSFCGYEFDFDNKDSDSCIKSCKGCPTAFLCKKPRCPYCGFELALHQKKINKKKTILSSYRKGFKGIIQDIDTTDKSIMNKLMALGLVPGVPVFIVQTFPAYIIESENTTVALDKDIADVIIVFPDTSDNLV